MRNLALVERSGDENREELSRRGTPAPLRGQLRHATDRAPNQLRRDSHQQHVWRYSQRRGSHGSRVDRLSTFCQPGRTFGTLRADSWFGSGYRRPQPGKPHRRYSFRMEAAAEAVEKAVEKVLKRGAHTAEIAGRGRPTSTSRMGDLIADEVQKILKSKNSKRK